MQIRSIGPKHTSSSTNKMSGSMASQRCVADRAKNLLVEKPKLGAKEDSLEKKYNISLRYGKVWNGR